MPTKTFKRTPATRKAFKDGLNLAMKQLQVQAKKLPKGTFAKYGKQAGGYLGGLAGNSAIGAKMGAAMGKAAAKISGYGDYTIHEGVNPTAETLTRVARGIKGRGLQRYHHAPGILNTKGEMTLTHTEYIGEVLSGTANPSGFTSQTYGINAGNFACFPFLSTIANQFQEFDFHKLVFEYRPLVSESSSTTSGSLLSMGSVVMATQYDSSVGPYPNKQQMENSDFAISCKPSECMMHPIECSHSHNPLGIFYTSPNTSTTNSGVSNADIRMQNLGLFQIASVGCPTAGGNSVDLGELYCHYSVTLRKPIEGNYGSVLSAHYTDNTATGNPFTTTPFGANVSTTIQPTQKSGSLLALTFTAAGVVTFPVAISQGVFLVQYCCKGNAQTTNVSIGTPVNCTQLSIYNNDADTENVSPQTSLASDTSVSCTVIISINAPGASQASITVSSSIVPSGGHFDLFVTPWNENIVN